MIIKGYVDITEIETGKKLVDNQNIVVNDARFGILYALAGQDRGHITILKLGMDFVSSWSTSGLTGTTDPFDGRKIHLSGDPSGFLTGTNNYIRVNNEIREIVAYTASYLTIDTPFDNPLSSTPWLYYSGNFSEQSPEPAQITYDENVMEVIYDSRLATVSSLQYNIAPTVPHTLSITHIVRGSEMKNQNSGQQLFNVYSAALHTHDGKVFSYLRFPRFSLTEHISALVTWRLVFV